MKNKGIPFIEQHVEKIFLGVAGVAFLSIVAWQVLGTHNNIMLDGKSTAPGELDNALSQKTQSLAGKLEQPAPALDEALRDRLAPQSEKFAKKLGSSVSPSAELPRVEPILAAVLQSDGATTGRPFHVPRFPALAMRSARVFSDTIDSTFLAEKTKDGSSGNPFVSFQREKFGASAKPPFDVTWVVTSAEIDVAAIRDELNSKQGGDSIPEVWYGKRLFIVDVEFERERQMPDGTWGDRAVVPVLPGQRSVRAEIEKGMSDARAKTEGRAETEASLRDRVMDQLVSSGFQQGLLQPEFFPTKQVGDVSNFDPSDIIAKPVVETEANSEQKAKEKKLRRRQIQSQFRVDRLTEQLADLGGPAEEAPKDDKDDRRGSNRGSGAGGGGGGGAGGGMNRPGSGLGGSAGGMQGGRRSGQSEENLEQRVDLTKRLRALEKELEEINKDLELLVGKDAVKSTTINTTDLLTAESVIAWAHDLSANAGDTYRYRAVAKVYNPFFTSGPLLIESQKKLAEDFSLQTQTAGWSDPVRVGSPVEFFVTQAVVGEGKLGLGSASVEVYRFHDGDRRLESFSVQPGDRIGGEQDGIDYDTGYFLVDIYLDPSTERSAADRRPAAIAVVQNLAGDRYEIRVPRVEAESETRQKYLDFAKLRALETAGKSDSKGESKGDGKNGSNRPPA